MIFLSVQNLHQRKGNTERQRGVEDEERHTDGVQNGSRERPEEEHRAFVFRWTGQTEVGCQEAFPGNRPALQTLHTAQRDHWIDDEQPEPRTKKDVRNGTEMAAARGPRTHQKKRANQLRSWTVLYFGVFSFRIVVNTNDGNHRVRATKSGVSVTACNTFR